jgi:hypothetical protein
MKWKKTSAMRVQKINSLENAALIDEILNDWPLYKHFGAPKLVSSCKKYNNACEDNLKICHS